METEVLVINITRSMACPPEVCSISIEVCTYSIFVSKLKNKIILAI